MVDTGEKEKGPKGATLRAVSRHSLDAETLDRQGQAHRGGTGATSGATTGATGGAMHDRVMVPGQPGRRQDNLTPGSRLPEIAGRPSSYAIEGRT